MQWIVRTAKLYIFQDPREEARKAPSDTMSFDNRKFSMNRSTGAPRESTKLNRRFTMSEPSVSGMLLLLLSVRTTLRGHLRKSLPSCHPMPKLYLICLRNVFLEIGGSNTDHLAPPPFNTHTLPPRNKFQNSSPISQRSRRPQIPCWTRPNARVHRRNLVHRTCLRAWIPRKSWRMGESGPRSARS